MKDFVLQLWCVIFCIKLTTYAMLLVLSGIPRLPLDVERVLLA